MNRSIAIALSSVVLCLVLCACAGQQPSGPAAAPQGEVQFLDTGGFDRKLSAALAAKQPEVVVSFPAAITLNSIPERLDRWFSKVEKFGGTVDIQAEPEPGRSIISEIFGLFVKAYDAIAEAVIYAPAKEYNVIVHYRATTGIVTRVSFLRKDQVAKDAPAKAAPAPAQNAAPAP